MKRALAERAKQETEEINRGATGVVLGASSDGQLKSPSSATSPTNHETDSLNPSSSSLLSLKIPRINSSGPSFPSPRDILGKDPTIPISTVSSATPTSISEVHTQTIISPPLSSFSQVTNQPMSTNHTSLPQSVVSTPVTVPMQIESSNAPSSSSSLLSVLKNPKKRSRSITTTAPYASSSASGGVEVLSNIHTTVDGEESAVDNGKGFYLIQQNRALASELFQYKRVIRMLEEERGIRREECQKIGQVIGTMISSWIETETILVGFLQSHLAQRTEDEGPSLVTSLTSLFNTSSAASVSDAVCTGSGKDVEFISNIVDLLSTLSKSPFFDSLNSEKNEQSAAALQTDEFSYGDRMSIDPVSSIQSEQVQEAFTPNVIMLESDSPLMKMLSLVACAFKDRCHEFHKLLVQFLSHCLHSTSLSAVTNDAMDEVKEKSISSSEDIPINDDIFQVASLHTQLSALQNAFVELENQLEEMAHARDEANESERRVRRALYRLASGRLKLGEVLEVVEKSNSALSESELNACKNDACTTAVIPSSSMHTTDTPAIIADTIILDGETVTKNDVVSMRKKIDELSEICTVREQSLLAMASENESAQKMINSLICRDSRSDEILSEDDVKKSSCYQNCDTLRVGALSERDSLKLELDSALQRWSIAKGDLVSSRKTIDELVDKHNRRWKELVALEISITGSADGKDVDGTVADQDVEYIISARKISELENKLKHALDVIRQSDSLRISLADATTLNELYQAKLEELKLKISELSAEKISDGPVPGETSVADAAAASSFKPMKADQAETGSTNNGDEKSYRKIKKELSAAIISKDQAKGKLERAEKERDSLMKLNARLVKQCTEKDDMNAKSLSTILQLKQLSEQLEREKEAVEKKLKGIEQLALAARLATNAQDRAEEEMSRERELIKEEMEDLKKSLIRIQKEKAELECKIGHADTQTNQAYADLAAMRQHCDELITRNSFNENEIIKLKETTAIARKEAADAASRVQDMSNLVASFRKNPSDTGAYSSDVLLTQVNHLKGRLSCPVCNARDKQVILLRCRHMFCRQCVDTSIKNRSRKCPACGQRFDTKDVGDVWL